jgi:acyl-coenzyme A thioesterase PaaI-like protein
MRIPPHHDPSCWGCGDNPGGLRLPAPEREGLTDYAATFRFDDRHQGGPGIAHGGLVAAALDEAAGLLATWYAFPTVTARMFTRFRRPVPINTDLALTARIDDARGRRVHTTAAISQDGERLAEARVALLRVPLEHFLATPEGRAAAERLRDPSRLDAG